MMKRPIRHPWLPFAALAMSTVVPAAKAATIRSVS